MVILLCGVNRDPAVFHEPDAFRPERMVGAAFDRLPAGAQKWFGSGKRTCAGRYYAWLWSVVVECGCGVWLWSVVVECGCGVWLSLFPS